MPTPQRIPKAHRADLIYYHHLFSADYNIYVIPQNYLGLTRHVTFHVTFPNHLLTPSLVAATAQSQAPAKY